MAQNDTLKRYLDAGQDFLRELAKAGEVQREQAEKWIEGLVERNRKQTEELVNLVRREVAEQLKNMGLEDLAKRAGVTPDPGGASKSSKGAGAVKAGPLATTATGSPVGAKATAPKKSAPKKAAPAAAAAAPKAPVVKKAAAGGEAAALGLKAPKKAAPVKKFGGAKKAGAKKAPVTKKSGPTA